jgi:antitoxin HicB
MTDRTIEYYMRLPYRVEIFPEEDGSGYTAVIPDLPGCLTSAPTIEELGEMITEAKTLWLEVALEDGDYIPEPAPVEAEEYSGRFVVRLPRSLHRQLAHRAGREDTSLNQLVVALLAEGMGRWTSHRSLFREAYFERPGIKPFVPTGFQNLRTSVRYLRQKDEGLQSPFQWDKNPLVFAMFQGVLDKHD